MDPGWRTSLEFEPHRYLAGASAAEFDAARTGNLAEAAAGDIQLGIAQIDAIGDVRERTFELQADALHKHKALRHPGIPTEGARPSIMPTPALPNRPSGAGSRPGTTPTLQLN